jgi:hypothetical protein
VPNPRAESSYASLMRSRRASRFAAGVALVLPLALGAQSAAMPANVRAACDEAFAIVAGTGGAKTRRSVGGFNDETFRAPIPGCRIDVSGSFKKAAKTGAAADRLRSAFEARRWEELPEFSADGHDGTSFAFRKGDVACFARGEWDGGADDEPEVEAADPYAVFVVCGSAGAFVRPEIHRR